MSRVSKTVVTFTVLHCSDTPLPPSLDAILQETDYGHAVGLETSRVTVDVPEDTVRDELLALGNDGEFFEDDD
ncbi:MULTISPECIES: hypothetical protein [Mycobacterium]|uniref:Uncharacterized protein n=3 Tax=Mycobacterium TaxID=1763 RepID=A0AAW5SB39_MYCBC|nr:MULTISPECIES: hypothetical protein [Mycobacterium]MBZ4631663.1 hypothetical protein [Mycobacterium avium subsp. hominissuis]MCV6991839.1 hypothetical protein [Mycobacterium bouchedurhonense]MCV6993660.1 hypothetical protein [Mycobacterium timonense]ORA45760.1 hypothetical protein BST19_19880 [Mycobacterium bouchedurhonense]ORW04915.1 hypothetical protein AWC14_02180 [Mycobacterium kyorinense]